MDKTNATDTLAMDALMTIALKEIIREDWDAVTSASEAPPLSPKYNRRMERMISSGGSKKRNRGRLEHIGIGILVALAVFAMLGMAIPPVREALIHTVFTWYDTHFGVRYDVQEHTFPTYIENEILPAWIPDGWTIAKELSNLACSAHSVSDGKGNEIFMEQYPIQPNNETVWFDNTDVTIQTVFLNGKTEAKLFSYAEGSRILTWVDRYVFILSGSADEGGDSDVLIRIAESMKP